MNHTDYVDLLRPAILHGGVWADLGSGRKPTRDGRGFYSARSFKPSP